MTKAPEKPSNAPMTRPEELLAIHDQNYGHTVSFAGLSGGRILMYGNGEFCITSDGGITWSKSYRGKDKNGNEVLPGSECSIVDLPGGGIGISYVSIGSTAGLSWREQMELVFHRSDDECKTFSDRVVMNTLLPSRCWQDTLIRTSSGRLILPVYCDIGQTREPTPWHYEGTGFVGGYLNGNFVSSDSHFLDPRFGASYVLYSDDEGQTWKANSDGEMFILCDPGGPFYPSWEPSVAEISPGKLLMFVRTNMGRVFQAWSEDNGENWSRLVPTQLASSHTSVALRRLTKFGHLLCVWTQQSEKEIKQGFTHTRMSSAISRNGGGIWEHFQNVESIHEETHVEPGPIRMIRPEGLYAGRLTAGFEDDSEYIVPFPDNYGRWGMPSVFVAEDRVLISHSYTRHDPKTGYDIGRGGSKLKVLPLTWFYGGQEPFESPLLEKLARAPEP